MDKNLIIIAAVAAFALIAFLVLKASESELKKFITTLGIAYLVGLGVVYVWPWAGVNPFNPTIVAAWIVVIPVAIICGMIARIQPAKPAAASPPPPPPPKTADQIKREVDEFLKKHYK